MPIQQICPQCHNNTFHFDINRHAIVCDVCGAKINESDNAQEELEYDRNRQKAIAFIRSGYYNNAIQHLENMRRAIPDDPDIYYLHLMGITKCCSDMLDSNDNKELENARSFWDKLNLLGGDTSLLLQYMGTRKKFGIQKYEKELHKHLIKCILLLSAIIVFGLLSITISYWYIAGIIGSIVLMYQTRVLQKAWNSMKKINEIESSDNPFFTMR